MAQQWVTTSSICSCCRNDRTAFASFLGVRLEAAEKQANEIPLKEEKDKESQISLKAAEDMLNIITPEHKSLHPEALSKFKETLWPDQGRLR